MKDTPALSSSMRRAFSHGKWRKARKQHKCDCGSRLNPCPHAIENGEFYFDTNETVDGPLTRTLRYSAKCATQE